MVDAADSIRLSLGMETCQVIAFKFRGTWDYLIGNPEPNLVQKIQTQYLHDEIGAETRWKLFQRTNYSFYYL